MRIATTTLLIIALAASAPAFAGTTPGQYGPVYDEPGLHESGDAFSVSAGTFVNLFGGTMIAVGSDVALSSTGDFAFGFSRMYSSVRRNEDGPLGVGWVGHYGLLILNPGQKPQFEDGTGARQLFYAHDQPSLSGLKPTGKSVVGISPTLSVLTLEGGSYYMYTATGLRYQFALRSQNRHVPVSIWDKYGNLWTVTYGADWWTQYPNHPIVESVVDEAGRTLDFVYTNDSPPRLDKINLVSAGSTLLQASYTYTTDVAAKVLHEHKTPLGRTTTYAYDSTPGSSFYRTISSMTLPTGGVTSFGYEIRSYIWSGSPGTSAVVATKTITKATDTWSIAYPAVGSSGNTFRVTITGPGSTYLSTRTFYGYTDGACTATDHWKVGRLLSMSETLGAYSRSATYVWDSLQVSSDSVFTACGWTNVYGTRLKSTSMASDGLTTTTTVDVFHQLKPEDTSTTTGIKVLRDMDDFVSGTTLFVGRVASEEMQYATSTVGKRTFSGFTGVLPRDVYDYKNTGSALHHVIDYYGAGSPGKLGRVKTVTTGTYYEGYDYKYGVVSGTTYPLGPSMVRVVSPDGRAVSETARGVTTGFEFDPDGRLRRVARAVDADTIFDYSGNTVTVTQGPSWKKTYVDAWGRLDRLEEMIDGVLVSSHPSYDAYGRQTTLVSPSGLVYTTVYDLEGRLRSKTSSVDSLTVAVTADSTGVTQTSTKNGTVTVAEKRDFLGRLVEGSTNGNTIAYSYSALSDGIKQTITPTGGVARSVTVDWLGNKVRDSHPELDGDVVYSFDSRGWVETITTPSGATALTYFDNGQLNAVSRSDYAGGDVVYDYDPTYRSLSSIAFGGVTRSMSNFDGEGRARKLDVTVSTDVLPAPAVNVICQ